MNYVCKICNETITTPINFRRHIKNIHHLENQEYYDKFLKKSEDEGKCKICGKPTKYYGYTKGYADCCSISCSNKYLSQNAESVELECKICHKTVSGIGNKMASAKLATHLKREHEIDVKTYYDTYIKKENEGICPSCGKSTEFRSLLIGYNEYCSLNCAHVGHKQDKNSYISKLALARNIRETIINMTNAIKEKYQNFIKNENKTEFPLQNVREDNYHQKLIKKNSEIETPEGIKVPLKTEIAVTTQQKEWVGTQDYLPKKEFCQRNYTNRFMDDINDEQGFSSNEWC